jgi:hypothetical protein
MLPTPDTLNIPRGIIHFEIIIRFREIMEAYMYVCMYVYKMKDGLWYMKLITLYNIEVEVTLRLTVSQSVCRGVEPTLLLVTRYYFLFKSVNSYFKNISYHCKIVGPV